MTPLRSLPLAILDVETTGLGPGAQVIEVAVAHLDLGSDAPRLVFAERVRPTVPIDEGATKAHGITAEDLVDCRSWAEALPDVLAACAGRVPVAYNAPFDFGHIPEVGWPWLDLLPVVQVVDKFDTGKSLTSALARRGVVIDAHGAAGDVVGLGLIASEVLRKAMKLCKTQKTKRPCLPVPQDLVGLHVWMRDLALWVEADLVGFAARERKMTAPDSPWHRLSGLEPPPFTPPAPATRGCPACGAPVVLRVARDAEVVAVTVDGVGHDCRQPTTVVA